MALVGMNVGVVLLGWIILCIIRVKSFNEWYVGKVYFVIVIIVGFFVIVSCLLLFLCLFNIFMVEVNVVRILMLIRISVDFFFCF